MGCALKLAACKTLASKQTFARSGTRQKLRDSQDASYSCL